MTIRNTPTSVPRCWRELDALSAQLDLGSITAAEAIATALFYFELPKSTEEETCGRFLAAAAKSRR